jgi:two-component system NtrC family sensor kinase
MEKVKCWEVFQCKKKECPAHQSRNLNCWLFSGTHCRDEIQGKFIDKMEMCIDCEPFKMNMDTPGMRETCAVFGAQLKEYKQIVKDRDRELENISIELAVGLSEVFEALKSISSGDPLVRIPEVSNIELINKLKHLVNLTAQNIKEIVDLSHEFAIGLAEHFDVLHKVSAGDLYARVSGESHMELLESLKRVTNKMIMSISKETDNRKQAEVALQKAHDKLEHRVEERTTELRILNEKLWTEIVERKRVEEELREAELRYRTVSDFTYDWEYWETPDGKLRYVSPSCERITGFTPKDFIDNPNLIFEIIIPEDHSILDKHRHDAIKALSPQSIMFRITRKDGKMLWMEHVCQAVIGNQGEFLGVRASNRDITIRKQAEEKLSNTLSLLSATLESTADGILVVNREGKIARFNQKFLQMWHIPESVIASKDDRKVIDFVLEQLKDPETFLTKITELYASDEAESFDMVEFKDERIFERFSQPQKLGNTVVGRVWSFRDITERKRAENALRESEQLLLQAHKMEAIGRLAAGVAHEINNPLAVINENAGLMKDLLELSENIEQNKEKFLGTLDVIFENVNRCRTITHRLLGFARRTDISYAVINVNDAVSEVIGFLEKEILYRNIHLKLNLKEDLPSVVSDKGQLQQVLLNIINNAIDAVEKGGLIEVFTDIKDGNAIRVSVRDNGPGIPEDIIKHIFEPFFTTKEKGKGTGLGLSISYGIMRKMGGIILVESKNDNGTTFIVEIPQKGGTD